MEAAALPPAWLDALYGADRTWPAASPTLADVGGLTNITVCWVVRVAPLDDDGDYIPFNKRWRWATAEERAGLTAEDACSRLGLCVSADGGHASKVASNEDDEEVGDREEDSDNEGPTDGALPTRRYHCVVFGNTCLLDVTRPPSDVRPHHAPLFNCKTTLMLWVQCQLHHAWPATWDRLLRQEGTLKYNGLTADAALKALLATQSVQHRLAADHQVRGEGETGTA